MKREVQNKQDTFIAAASIYQALFNRMTIPLGDHAIINFDELSHEVDYLREPGDEDLGVDEIRKKFNITELYNIVSIFEIVFLVGWKEHETLQKPLKPPNPTLANLSNRETTRRPKPQTLNPKP